MNCKTKDIPNFLQSYSNQDKIPGPIQNNGINIPWHVRTLYVFGDVQSLRKSIIQLADKLEEENNNDDSIQNWTINSTILGIDVILFLSGGGTILIPIVNIIVTDVLISSFNIITQNIRDKKLEVATDYLYNESDKMWSNTGVIINEYYTVDSGYFIFDGIQHFKWFYEKDSKIEYFKLPDINDPMVNYTFQMSNPDSPVGGYFTQITNTGEINDIATDILK